MDVEFSTLSPVFIPNLNYVSYSVLAVLWHCLKAEVTAGVFQVTSRGLACLDSPLTILGCAGCQGT